MAIITLNWTPGTGASNGQRASAIAKVNENTGNYMTTGFNPQNTLAAGASSTNFSTSNTNIVYKFKVENLCTNGSIIPNTNGLQEEIVFACIPPSFKSTDTTDTTYTARILKGAYTQVDGINYPNTISSISNIEYTLYDGVTIKEGPVAGTLTGTGSSEAFVYTFQNLTPGHTYTLKYVLKAFVNNLEIRSDNSTHLGVACTYSVTTTGIAGPSCLNYKIQNFQTGQGQPTSYSYTDCANNPQTGIVQPGTFEMFCAFNGTVVDGGAVLTVVGGCSNGVPCYNYTLDNPSIGNPGTYNYTDCGGVAQGPFTIAPQSTNLVCAKQNTVVKLSGTVNITQNGFC